MDHILGNLPDSFARIRPLFGDIVDLRFDTVGNVMYGIAIEVNAYDRWTVCYAARSYGYELMWMLRAVSRESWNEYLETLEDDIVDVSVTDDEDDRMLVVTREIDALRMMIFFWFDEPRGVWVLYLVLQFDLNSSINWAPSDDDSVSTAHSPEGSDGSES
jgi:hypothetical protein